MNLTDKVLGTIIGGAIGDAYGGLFEGNKAEDVNFKNAAEWQLSDDTQLTLATCEAIIECRGTVDPATIAARFARWHRDSRITGIGASTYKALSELVRGGHWALVGAKGERAAGNGAAMRIAPLAFCLDPCDMQERQTFRDVARITHHNEEAYAGSIAVAVAVSSAIRGQWNGENNLIALVANALPDTQVRDRLRAINDLDADLPLRNIALRFGNSGFVAESIPLALYGANRIRRSGFTKMIEEVIACGGDTDTTASIAGQIAGALIGYSGLPVEMVERLPGRDLIERIAKDFADMVAIHYERHS